MTAATRLRFLPASVAPLLVGVLLAGAQAADSPEFPPPSPPGESLQMPGMPAIPLPPGLRIFPRAFDEPGAGIPDADDPSPPEPPRAAQPVTPRAEPMAPAARRQKLLDDLFGRLGKSDDATEAQGIASAIQRVWMRSDSDTADLLMERAMTAVDTKDLELAETLLDKVVQLEPDWPEAWNKRSTVRYLRDDDVGAMQDAAQVLAREPRHFGALAGMGAILHRECMDKEALKVLRRALELDPQLTDIRKLVDQLKLDVEGREI